MTWVVGPVELDGLVEVVAQYDTEVRWNGWLCPLLDPLAVVRVLDTLIAMSPGAPPFAYDFVQGVLFVDDLDDPSSPTDWYEPDVDGLYDLGSHAWVWSAVRDPDRAARHLTVVPVLPEIVCMYAETDGASCGGQVTQIGDGRDYCQNHGSLRFDM